MANSDTSPSRVGLVEGGSDNQALFLKKFSGEILTTFEEKNIMKPLHTIRTIQNGKSAQFPVTGVATASYHTPGQNIADAGNAYLSDIAKTEKVINIDKVLLASTFLANIDDVMNHYDIRSVYANELGNVLANRFDTAVLKTFIAAARSAANLTQTGKTGRQLDVSKNLLTSDPDYGSADAVSDPTGATLIAALFTAAQKLDENDVSSDGRFCVLSPENYYKLLTGGGANGQINVASSAVNSDIGGQGSIATGNIPQIAGISIFKSNHVPTNDLTSGNFIDTSHEDYDNDNDSNNNIFGGTTGYNGNFTNTVGIVAHSSAVGTVKLLDLATESEYQIERQGTLFVAKYAMGHGVLRPESCIELVK